MKKLQDFNYRYSFEHKTIDLNQIVSILNKIVEDYDGVEFSGEESNIVLLQNSDKNKKKTVYMQDYTLEDFIRFMRDNNKNIVSFKLIAIRKRKNYFDSDKVLFNYRSEDLFNESVIKIEWHDEKEARAIDSFLVEIEMKSNFNNWLKILFILYILVFLVGRALMENLDLWIINLTVFIGFIIIFVLVAFLLNGFLEKKYPSCVLVYKDWPFIGRSLRKDMWIFVSSPIVLASMFFIASKII